MKARKKYWKRIIEDCPKHPHASELTCKTCHQITLDFAEMKLMDLHEEIKGIMAHAQWDLEMGASSKWGWTKTDFVVRCPRIKKQDKLRRLQ